MLPPMVAGGPSTVMHGAGCPHAPPPTQFESSKKLGIAMEGTMRHSHGRENSADGRARRTLQESSQVDRNSSQQQKTMKWRKLVHKHNAHAQHRGPNKHIGSELPNTVDGLFLPTKTQERPSCCDAQRHKKHTHICGRPGTCSKQMRKRLENSHRRCETLPPTIATTGGGHEINETEATPAETPSIGISNPHSRVAKRNGDT